MRTVVFLLAALGAGYVGGWLTNQVEQRPHIPASIRAQRFELMDSAGTVRGRWFLDPVAKGVRFCLYPSDDICKLEIFAKEDGAYVAIRRNKGSVDASLGSLNGRSTLNMRDDRSGARLVLGYRPGDIPNTDDYSWALSFLRGSFDTWAAIGTSPDPATGKVAGFIALTDESGKTVYLPNKH